MRARPGVLARLTAWSGIVAVSAGIAVGAASLVDPQQHGTRALVGLMTAATVVLCAVPLYGAWAAWCERRSLPTP
ncbi:hypothetical protein [Kitasatospora sp. GP82]|uniref:hypothetical protein n=1 Tax=Kitasatospora sp. GP82 TaxID=3035089 RepID=UPI002475A597|nr:hypothetical protein [Kitasatospora sp. GP82]MDH6130422.1 hypothetical protein [Kitasatospora sp. GP82]